MNDIALYAERFAAGMKVGVGIPLPDSEVFNDWAIINTIDEDLVSLQLSRDQLPSRVTLHVGQILELRASKEGTVYSCRAIIVSEGREKHLLLRLIGEIVSDELREFYRIDTFLPIRYYPSPEQNPDVLKTQWAARRKQRTLQAQELQQSPADAVSGDPAPGEAADRQQGDEGGCPQEDPWESVIPLAANIGGGGLRMLTRQRFEPGDYILLEIFVPAPRRIVDTVVRVVFSGRNCSAGDEQPLYSTGLKFVFINERDRDAIVHYISSVQLIRIRQLRERFLLRSSGEVEGEEGGRAEDNDWKLLARKAFHWAAMIAFLLLLAAYLRNYASGHPKHEIGEAFENGLKKLMENNR